MTNEKPLAFQRQKINILMNHPPQTVFSFHIMKEKHVIESTSGSKWSEKNATK